jgi:molybdopterin synthase catalytic subunit
MSETTKIRVRAFAGLRDALGAGSLDFEAAAGSDVGSLLQQLATAYPGADLANKHFSVAVNRQYCAHDALLSDGDEVALIPPVSGGSGKLFEITASPISLDDATQRVSAPDRGGITVFAGTVRGVTGEVTTDYLEYEAYAEMAEPVLESIAAEAQARWPEITAVSVIHRVGRLEVGDISVAVAVAAAHRRDTFDACHYIIDRVKQIAPIWKKEVGSDGAIWVEGPESTI